MRDVAVKDFPFTVENTKKSLNSRVMQQILELSLLSPNEIISKTKKMKKKKSNSDKLRIK